MMIWHRAGSTAHELAVRSSFDLRRLSKHGSRPKRGKGLDAFPPGTTDSVGQRGSVVLHCADADAVDRRSHARRGDGPGQL